MSRNSVTEHSDLDTFEARVMERRVGPCRLIMLPTPVQSVVTWRGSFMSYPDLDDDENLLQNVVVSLLDKGTHRRDRFAIAELLENKGAQVTFSSDGLYVDVSGRALREDVPDVLGLVAEQLREPLFDGAEVEKAKARIGASLRRSMENTGSQASGALTRQIYPNSHPNFTPDPAERLVRLESISPDDVVQYHRRHFGGNAFTLAVVGDLEPDEIAASVREYFSGWEEHEATPAFLASAGPGRGGRTELSMPGKQNADVRMGHPVSFRRDDPEYIPAYLGNYILGGNFSARLMQTIRDELGLTYGIRSGLYGVSAHYEGHWQVAVTLSLDNVERGIEETLREVDSFVDEGPTAEELADKKTTVIGSFKVGLATTSGLASTLLKNAENGFDVGYLDRFAGEVNGVSLGEVKSVIAEHFKPETFHIAVAGGLAEPTR